MSAHGTQTQAQNSETFQFIPLSENLLNLAKCLPVLALTVFLSHFKMVLYPVLGM